MDSNVENQKWLRERVEKDIVKCKIHPRVRDEGSELGSL